MERKVGLILCLICFAAAAWASTNDDVVFIHHSCGANWLGNSLHAALLAKIYIDERNDITYGTDVAPDPGRPDPLQDAYPPGHHTDMDHWICWFNDYLEGVKAHACANGTNRIIMFKSCYPISNVTGDGTEPGDPFSGSQTLANYRAVYRKYNAPGGTYTNSTYEYKPLEDIFAENPDILFIPVTAPPRHYAPSDATTDAEAQRARIFNNWLKNDWLASYNSNHPGYHNVAVFDWFNLLAYPSNHSTHPNRLTSEYGGESGNSHPNSTANATSTWYFATSASNFLDPAWAAFTNRDTDYDGMADWWEWGYFTNLASMTTNSDTDSDGFIDVFEFRAGTDATNGNSLLAITNFADEVVSECVIRWPSVGGKRYAIERSTNLVNGFTTLSNNIAATPPVNAHTDTVDGVGAACYRIRLD